MTRWRRLVRDYEARIDVSQAMIHVAMGGLLLRRIAHREFPNGLLEPLGIQSRILLFDIELHCGKSEYLGQLLRPSLSFSCAHGRRVIEEPLFQDILLPCSFNGPSLDEQLRPFGPAARRARSNKSKTTS